MNETLRKMNPYRIVTLCGSMRFRDQIMEVAARETAALHIVIAPFSVVPPDQQDSDFKASLDMMHLSKIVLADEVVVVYDETMYIGESTRREIKYAQMIGLPVRYEMVATNG